MDKQEISIVVILLVFMSISFLYSCSVVVEDDVFLNQGTMIPAMDSIGN